MTTPLKLPVLAFAILIVLVTKLAFAQRVQFPTAIESDKTTAFSAPGTASSGWAPVYTTQASPSPVSTYPTPAPAYPDSAYPSMAAPGQLTQPSGPSTPIYIPQPSYATPSYATPPSYAPTPAPSYTTVPPGSPAPVYSPSPMVVTPPIGQPNSAILPPPSWDPYGVPAMQPQPASPLLPQDPYLQSGPTNFSDVFKFRQDIRFDYLWMAGNSFKQFGFNQLDLNATFAFPFFTRLQQSPLLVTPGMTVYFLSDSANGPNELYDVYLDAAWNPNLNEWLGSELGFRIGIYSDFGQVTDQSIRFTGHGLAVVALSPGIQLKAGLVYLDRVYIKVLPAGGIVWTPNSDTRVDILFPNPKISKRITTYGMTDWWLYLRGEYGGDSWTMPGFWTPSGFQRGPYQQVDYNDIRIALGVEFLRRGGLSGQFEIGCAFDREIRAFPTGDPVFAPDATVFLHAGLSF